MAKSHGSRKTRASLAEHRQALSEAQKDLPSILVLDGPEEQLRRTAAESITRAIRKRTPQAEIVSLHAGDSAAEQSNAIGQLLSELGTNSLFASERLIHMHDADNAFFGKTADSTSGRSVRSATPLDRFLEYLTSPTETTWLLLEFKKLQRNRRAGKALAKLHVIPCPALTRRDEVTSWLTHTARDMGKDLEPGVSDILTTTHGTDLGSLQAELEKLATYVGDNRTIHPDDARAFLSGSSEFDVFGLTNSLEKRDLNSALDFARRISRQGLRDQAGKRTDGSSSSHRALAMMCNTVEGILAARVLSGQGGDAASLASELGTSPWRAEHLLQASRLYSLAELRRIMNTLCDEIRATHDTGGDVALSLERCVLACCSSTSATA